MNFCKNKYFVIYRGDDTDFPGNQELIIELNTTRDLTGCKAHFSFQGFTQDFDEIPADKKLHLVIPNSATEKFALGAADAKLWLTNGTKIRTVENRIHIVVTNRVDEAYDNDDPQAITVTISGGGGGATVVLDDTVTEKSPNGVKSSGIWSWVKSLLPHWLTSDYAEPATVASVADKRDKSDLAVYSVTRTENTDWTITGVENADGKTLSLSLFDDGTACYWEFKVDDVAIGRGSVAVKEAYPELYDEIPKQTYVEGVFAFNEGYGPVSSWKATRPRYMDETLGPAKPNQQISAVATDDAAKPADGSLMKYDAANDRLVKAVEGTDYLKTHQDISGKLDKSGGQMTGILSGGDGFGWIMNRQGESLDDTLGTFPTYLDLATKADLATTLSGYGITDGATKTELAAAVSTNNPAFVSAVRNTPTENIPEDMPTDWGTYGTVGAALAALAAFVKWAKAKIVAVIGDDGKPTNQFATDLLGKQVANAKVRYSLATESSATMADRTVNIYTLSSGTVQMVFPAATTHDGKTYARDFLLKLTYSGGTLQMPTGVTKVGDELSFEAGKTYLIAFTEIAADKFYVRSIDITEAQA